MLNIVAKLICLVKGHVVTWDYYNEELSDCLRCNEKVATQGVWNCFEFSELVLRDLSDEPDDLYTDEEILKATEKIKGDVLSLEELTDYAKTHK